MRRSSSRSRNCRWVRGLDAGRLRGGGINARRPAAHQAADHQAGAKNHQRRKNDFPDVHRISPAWSVLLSTAAIRVCSTSCGRLSELADGRKNDAGRQQKHERNAKNRRARQRAAPKVPRIHRRLPASRAMMRFSKAKGTRSSGGMARAAAINFLHGSNRFIGLACLDALLCPAVTNTSLSPAAPGIFSFPRARGNARTFTSGTDHPVNSAISLMDRSSISSSVITSRAAGESCSSTRSTSCRAAAAFSARLARMGHHPVQPVLLRLRSIRKTPSPGCAGGPAENHNTSAPSAASANARTAPPRGTSPASGTISARLPARCPPPRFPAARNAGRWQKPAANTSRTSGSKLAVSPFNTSAMSSASVASMCFLHYGKAMPVTEAKSRAMPGPAGTPPLDE